MIYLDNAATTFPKPVSVLNKMHKCMSYYCANPGRSGHDMSVKMSSEIYETREVIARFFNIQDPLRIVFTANATESLNLAIKGILNPGDHVITTVMEHNSVLRPLKEFAGITVTLVAADEKGDINYTEIEKNINKNTKLIICTHSSNVTGNVYNIKHIGEICRKHNICFLVDASQSAGIIDINVERDYIDMLACPGHKSLMGPQGTGFLYVNSKIKLEPLKSGGTGTDSIKLDQPRYFPEGYESGTLNGPGILGLKEGINFISKVGITSIHEWEAHLCKILYDELKNNSKVTVYGPEKQMEKSSIILINIEGMSCEDVAYELNKTFGIAVRSGYHCAPLAHKTIGTFDVGAIRLSPGIFTTKNEIYKTINSIYKISSK